MTSAKGRLGYVGASEFAQSIVPGNSHSIATMYSPYVTSPNLLKPMLIQSASHLESNVTCIQAYTVSNINHGTGIRTEFGIHCKSLVVFFAGIRSGWAVYFMQERSGAVHFMLERAVQYNSCWSVTKVLQKTAPLLQMFIVNWLQSYQLLLTQKILFS